MANSKISANKGEKPTIETEPSVPELSSNPVDALEALRSAVELCREAGMVVRAGNSAKTGEMLIAIWGAAWVQGQFVPKGVPQAAESPDA